MRNAAVTRLSISDQLEVSKWWRRSCSASKYLEEKDEKRVHYSCPIFLSDTIICGDSLLCSLLVRFVTWCNSTWPLSAPLRREQFSLRLKQVHTRKMSGTSAAQLQLKDITFTLSSHWYIAYFVILRRAFPSRPARVDNTILQIIEKPNHAFTPHNLSRLSYVFSFAQLLCLSFSRRMADN